MTAAELRALIRRADLLRYQAQTAPSQAQRAAYHAEADRIIRRAKEGTRGDG
jgi:hypothetical protein